MHKKIIRDEWICPICNQKYIISINKRKECKICNKFLNSGYKESEILRKISEYTEINKRTELFKDNITTNNPTFKKFWLDRGYSFEEVKKQTKINSKVSIEYWIDRGYSLEEAKIYRDEQLNHAIKERIEYWLNKGFSLEEATLKQNEQIQWRANFNRKNFKYKNNILRKEYWIERGYNEDEAIINIKKEQKRRFSHLTHKDYSNAAIKRSENLKLNDKKYKEYLNTLSISNNDNIFKSPIFKEFWVNKGFSEEESKRKVRDIKFINQDGNRLSSKIEIKCIKELEKYLNIKIETGKFRYIENKYFCYDGKYKNFIIEFNGTHFHLDERFYNVDDKTPYGKLFEQKHNEDQEKINKTLTKYNVIIIWEHDYLNKKEIIFNNIKQFIKNENNKKGKYWNSASI